MKTLQDHHALVTGASRGIGATTAEHLADRGADVTLMARSLDELEARSDELAAEYDGEFAVVTADVTDELEVEYAVEEAREVLGPVDLLVNNAGAVDSAPFAETDAQLWRKMMSVNLDGVYHVTREIFPGMVERGNGRVVNNASVSGLVGYKFVSAYSAAKHGVVGLTKSLAKEAAGAGVTVNAVCPGYVETAMVEESARELADETDRDAEAIKESFERQNPQDRFVQPEEVASTIAWLCEPAQRSVNGETIAIDGGESA